MRMTFFSDIHHCLKDINENNQNHYECYKWVEKSISRHFIDQNRYTCLNVTFTKLKFRQNSITFLNPAVRCVIVSYRIYVDLHMKLLQDKINT